MKGKKACGMKMGGKVKAPAKGYAHGGSVKVSTGGKSGTVKGMGKAKKGGHFSGCY